MSIKNDIRNWVIYKITSPNGGVYIGKTCNHIATRLSHYKALRCESQHLIYRSLKKYGYDAHTITIVDRFNSDKTYADGKEIFWIRSYMSNRCKFRGQNGLNLTNGGDGQIGFSPSKETRLRMSLKKRGKPPHNKGKTGQVAWNKGLKGVCVSWNKGKSYSHLTEEERKEKFGKHNLGNAYNKGRKQSIEFIEARRKRQTGKPLYKKRKIVLQYDLNNNLINKYGSVKEARESIYGSSSGWHNAIKNNNGKFKGYVFKYN